MTRRRKENGCVVWFTGLSGSGKSTLATALEKKLRAAGQCAFVLDGDEIRRGLCRDLGFSAADRNENIRRLAEVAKLFAECGVICISAFISPLRASRESAKRIVGPGRFFEIHLATPLKVCEGRDVKGLYAKARAGKIPEFTGISSPYQAPVKPALKLNTAEVAVNESVTLVLQVLAQKGFI